MRSGCSLEKTGELLDYCREMGCALLPDEWDADRNAPITPETIICASKRRVRHAQDMQQKQAAASPCSKCQRLSWALTMALFFLPTSALFALFLCVSLLTNTVEK